MRETQFHELTPVVAAQQVYDEALQSVAYHIVRDEVKELRHGIIVQSHC
jgi:hypothetical protein